jgi:hypothetical protein
MPLYENEKNIVGTEKNEKHHIPIQKFKKHDKDKTRGSPNP